ncbi:MAG: hypothetical protein QOF14_5525 [Hyphomicrobiales bacterium]|jgi:hypothetical protein|nr:hypothetical protein [Hyphomicrobiales bacterium]
MGSRDREGEDATGQESGQVEVRDLIDFYRRWHEFRETAVRVADRPDLSLSERQTIHWLIQLVDRVSEHDLKPVKRI